MYILIDKLRKIDEYITDEDITENIISMLPAYLQRNLPMGETGKLDMLIKYMHRMDRINMK